MGEADTDIQEWREAVIADLYERADEDQVALLESNIFAWRELTSALIHDAERQLGRLRQIEERDDTDTRLAGYWPAYELRQRAKQRNHELKARVILAANWYRSFGILFNMVETHERLKRREDSWDGLDEDLWERAKRHRDIMLQRI